MKYTKPTYISEKIESNDIILTSSVNKVDETSAEVRTSILDILGLI